MSDYLCPAHLNEALDALAARPYIVLAGGTDFYPARVGQTIREPILDITSIASLRGIVETDSTYHIGALTTWSELASASLPPYFDGLKAAAREIGGQQIQNVGTLVGNICNASPAADAVPNLLTLDAVVNLRDGTSQRDVPIGDFVIGNRNTIRSADELVIGITIKKPTFRSLSHFTKLGSRKYLVISIAMVSVVIGLDNDACVAQARIAVGACSEVAQRLLNVEQALLGQPFDSGIELHIPRNAAEVLSPIDDVRGTASYRRQVVPPLLRRTLLAMVATHSEPQRG